MRRILPALGLIFLSPLVAEFLLGNISITMLGSLIVLAPMYGCGALLIREVARRRRLTWRGILLLGLAFGILEEAFMTESLFNPDYLGLNLHLLEPAAIPGLGISAWWTTYVLTLHAIWSISVPIALTEGCVPDRAGIPWLRRWGLTVTILIFLVAAISVGTYSVRNDRNHFVATPQQFAAAAIAITLIVSVAWRMRYQPSRSAAGGIPAPWLAGLSAFIASSIFFLVPPTWGWIAVALYVILFVATAALIRHWSELVLWNGRYPLALASGATMTYAWHSFVQPPSVGPGGSVARIGNVIFTGAAICLLTIAARRTRTALSSTTSV